MQELPDVLDGEVATRRYEVKVSDDESMEPVEFEPEFMSQFEEHEKIVH